MKRGLRSVLDDCAWLGTGGDSCHGLLAALLLVLGVACGDQGKEPGEAPTIDVPPALTVDVENDPQAVEETPELVGVLPSDFPAEVPLYVPASLIDFGRSPRGLRSVSLISPHPTSRVRRELDLLMRDRGWSAGGSAAGENGTRWRKGALEVWLQVENARPGTRYVFEY